MIRETFQGRIDQVSHPLGKKLLRLMFEKSTNLTLSADVESCTRLLQIAKDLGPYICVLKTHVDCLSDFTINAMRELVAISDEHKFLIFEDRKFADIGHTVASQYGEGLYKIASWAHLINAHGLPGRGMVESLERVANDYHDRALLLLANMSSGGSLFNDSYQRQVFKMAEQHRDFVCGFIAPGLKQTVPGFLNFHPGVHLTEQGDRAGQKYRSPDDMRGTVVDSFIVGRGILQSKNPKQAAVEYKKLCWNSVFD